MRSVRFISRLTVLSLVTALVTWAQRPSSGRGLVRLRSPAEEAMGPLYTGSHALIIGGEHYANGWARLQGVAAEVDAIARTLRALDFSVSTVHDPTGSELHAACREFINRHGYEPGHRLFIFFAGHGHVRKDGRAYLVPADAPLPGTDMRAFLRVALPVRQITAWARTLEAKHVLFAFDCDIGSAIFATRSHDMAASVADHMSRPVRQFIVAGQPGTLDVQRGAFGRALCAGIEGNADVNADGFVTGTELGMYVREEVRQHNGPVSVTGKIRDPDLDEGDFCFRVVSGARVSAGSHLEARLAELRAERRRLEQEAQALAASGSQLAEWHNLELALGVIQDTDRKSAQLSGANTTEHGDQLAEILCSAASRALTAGDLFGASALAAQALELSPARKDAVLMFERVRREMAQRRIAIRRDAATAEMRRLDNLTIPKEVRGTLVQIEDIQARYTRDAATQFHLVTERWYDTIGYLSRALQAVSAGRGTAVYAEPDLHRSPAAGRAGPNLRVHVGNLSSRELKVALPEALRQMQVILTGPLPQRRTFALPEPFYAHPSVGKPHKVLNPQSRSTFEVALISPARIPADFFQSRDYPVPPPGSYRLHVEVEFPERDGSWSGSYRSLPQMVRVLASGELRR